MNLVMEDEMQSSASIERWDGSTYKTCSVQFAIPYKNLLLVFHFRFVPWWFDRSICLLKRDESLQGSIQGKLFPCLIINQFGWTILEMAPNRRGSQKRKAESEPEEQESQHDKEQAEELPASSARPQRKRQKQSSPSASPVATAATPKTTANETPLTKHLLGLFNEITSALDNTYWPLFCC